MLLRHSVQNIESLNEIYIRNEFAFSTPVQANTFICSAVELVMRSNITAALYSAVWLTLQCTSTFCSVLNCKIWDVTASPVGLQLCQPLHMHKYLLKILYNKYDCRLTCQLSAQNLLFMPRWMQPLINSNSLEKKLTCRELNQKLPELYKWHFTS